MFKKIQKFWLLEKCLKRSKNLGGRGGSDLFWTKFKLKLNFLGRYFPYSKKYIWHHNICMCICLKRYYQAYCFEFYICPKKVTLIYSYDKLSKRVNKKLCSIIFGQRGHSKLDGQVSGQVSHWARHAIRHGCTDIIRVKYLFLGVNFCSEHTVFCQKKSISSVLYGLLVTHLVAHRFTLGNPNK